MEVVARLSREYVGHLIVQFDPTAHFARKTLRIKRCGEPQQMPDEAARFAHRQPVLQAPQDAQLHCSHKRP